MGKRGRLSEANGEALILTRVQAVTGFASTNANYCNWKALNSGASDHYAIVKPGAFARDQLAMSANQTTWQTVIEVWQRYKDDGTTGASLRTHVDNIIAALDQYRKLGDTTGAIMDAVISSGGEVQEMWVKDGGPAWLRRDLTVTWQEFVNVTYAE